MIYFTADLHLGHKSVIKFCNRPFKTVEEMDETLITKWNSKVKKNDLVYVLGDMVWQKKEPKNYLSRLNGRKILIVGNHDKRIVREGNEAFFEKISKFEEVSLNGHQLTLCHYPMLEWKNSRKVGTNKLGYLIHGHTHNNVRNEYAFLFRHPNALNAGVDVNAFEPVTFEELVVNNENFSKKALLKLKDGNICQ